MKVAGNQVGHISDYYHSELDVLLGRNEVNAILNTVFEHYLGFKRNEWSLRGKENVNQSDLLKLYDCCKELKKGRPLQYIIQEAWFYNLKFYVNEEVLIPRPETEELVDLIIRENKECASALDIGTGSGCIAISLAKYLAGCKVTACDVSAGALEVARKNSGHHATHVNFFEADILSDNGLWKARNYDLIVSNPPYVKISEMASLEKQVIEHEPHLALFVKGYDDIVFYRQIIEKCAGLLKSKGRLYFELNPLTSESVKQCAEESGLFSSVELMNDMSGKQRFLKALKK
jgi:release factor glutamine methyltransferase